MPNELFGWCWILLGMLSGAVLGMGFQQERFLGGYTDRRRRLVRLGHISFFGLGFLNIFFAQSGARSGLSESMHAAAALALIVGGVTMPMSCALNAWRVKLHPVFVVPVASLLFGVCVTIYGLGRQ